MRAGAPPGTTAVLAASGQMGEKSDFFSLLVKGLIQHLMTPDLLYGIR
jgi:hypothetical protein